MAEDTLRIVVATPLSDDDLEYMHAHLPASCQVIREKDLLPTMRWPADFRRNPDFQRSSTDQRAFDALVDSADILYGIPDGSSHALARTVQANPRLRWVQIMAAGGGAQVQAAHLSPQDLERVLFTTGAGVHAQPLAEFALFGIMAGAKDFVRLQDLKNHKEWPGRWPMKSVLGSTVLILGLGGIGSYTAKLLHNVGMHVIGTSRKEKTHPYADRVIAPDDVAKVIGHVDAIVSTLPGTDYTRNFLHASLLAQVKPGVTIVSVGRGSVIDEDALIDGLRQGRVGLAVLDVFNREPLPTTSPLWELPNVIMSPHTAADSYEEERRLVELFIDNVHRFLANKPLRNMVNTVEFY